MLGTILFFIFGYLLCVAVYTYLVRNNATNKYIPDIKLFPIIKEGAIGFLIGFAILVIIYYLWGLVNYLLV